MPDTPTERYCCGYPMEKSGPELYCPTCNTVEDLPDDYED